MFEEKLKLHKIILKRFRLRKTNVIKGRSKTSTVIKRINFSKNSASPTRNVLS